jgi:N-acetylmuramic acid 6-phosphate etherase
VDLIGSHGQTLWHDVGHSSSKCTLQIGDGSVVANRTGITTVSDFRVADVALSGQGAPLVPFFDELMFGGGDDPVVLLNIGGIGNLTFLPGKKDICANVKIHGFDTGPGNMIMDRFVELATDGAQHYDVNGQLASRGNVCQELVEKLLQHEFFSLRPPRSTGREQFGHQFADVLWDTCMQRGLSSEDAIATVTAFTTESILRSIHLIARRDTLDNDTLSTFGRWPSRVIVSGGGAKNSTLIKMLQSSLEPCVVTTMTDVESNAKEAVAFAMFAYLAVCGRGNHSPHCTGADRETVLGKISPGRNFRLTLLSPFERHYNRDFVKYPRQCSNAYAIHSPLQESDDLLSLPRTEAQNCASNHLDECSAEQIVAILSREDLQAVQCSSALNSKIASLATKFAQSIGNGGRVFYVGAGTSGRLGTLDASEIPPTFSAPNSLFTSIIAGGDRALRNAVEGAEDHRDQGGLDLHAAAGEVQINPNDVVLGIAASGGTPYVWGALEMAKVRGAHTALLCCAPLSSTLTEAAIKTVDSLLCVNVGPEVITGSTRLKAGTATKLVLNQLSTTTMVLMGKTMNNLMVDVRATNVKLRRRALRIVCQVTGVNVVEGERLLDLANGKVKVAIAMHVVGEDKLKSEKELEAVGGRLGKLLETKHH